MTRRRRSILVLGALTLVVAAGCGSSSDEAGHDHTDHDHGEATPDRLREWTGSPPPAVSLALESNDAGDTVLTIGAPGFTFTPADVIEPIDGEGHAHLYVDGDLLTMIYEPTYRLPVLDPGDHELRVALSTNDHLEYAVDGEPLAGSIMLTASDSPTAHPAPVVPETATIETIEGVVVAVEGDLNRTVSFTLLVDTGDRITFVPTATATFHGGPIGHIRDHLTSGAPVIVEFAVLEDGTRAAISAADR